MTDGSAVVVTGASTGIGAGVARVVVAAGGRVFGGVRNPADGERLRTELGARFEPLPMDVTDAASIAAAAAMVDRALGGRRLAGLVNNAGIALGGPLALQPAEEIRRMFEVNLFGAVAVTQAFLPLLGTESSRVGAPGRIVNISSVGGRIGPPFLAGYAATKHALEGLSESLRRELLASGIDVVIVAPGAVATPIWDKADAADDSRYAASVWAAPLRRFVRQMVTDGRKGLAPEAIARVVLTALTAAHPRPRYAVVRAPLLNWTLPRLLPPRVVDRLIGGQLGLTHPG